MCSCRHRVNHCSSHCLGRETNAAIRAASFALHLTQTAGDELHHLAVEFEADSMHVFLLLCALSQLNHCVSSTF